MDKQEIYKLLENRHLWHKVFTHKAVYNMAEMVAVSLPYPEADAKIYLSGMIRSNSII